MNIRYCCIYTFADARRRAGAESELSVQCEVPRLSLQENCRGVPPRLRGLPQRSVILSQ